MIKLIKSNELKPGMFISGFKESWFNTPFLKHSFKICNKKQINRITAANISEVYIDTERGDDTVSTDPSPPENQQMTPSEQDIKKDNIQEAETKNSMDKPQVSTVPIVNMVKAQKSFSKEISRAKEIKNEISRVTLSVLKSVEMGEKIDIVQVKNIADSIVESLYRNNFALSSLLKLKHDNEHTFQHSVNVSILAPSFGNYLNMSENDLVLLGTGGLLHDLGKTRLPQELFSKRTSLTLEEMTLLKQHVEFTLDLLNEIPGLPDAVMQIAGEHHERSNGSGYPKGLKEDEISMFGKIVSIVDLFETLISASNSRATLMQSEVLILMKGMKRKLHGRLLDSFLAFMGIYPVGSYVLLSNGIIGAVIANNNNHPAYPVIRKVINSNGFQSSTISMINLSDQVFEFKDHIKVVREVLPIEYDLPTFGELNM